MRKLILIIACLWAGASWGQTDTTGLSPFEKYTKTEDFKQLQKRVREQDTTALPIKLTWGQSYNDDGREFYKQRELQRQKMADLKKKDSVLYEQAEEAYQQTPKNENEDEFIQLFILHNKWRKRDKDDQAKKVKDLTKKYGAAIAKKLLAEKVWIGMTDKMVIDEFGWADVKRTVTASGVTETWTYTPSSHCIGYGCPVLDYYMVFKNHKLIAIGDL